jgi:multidrug efflux pump subunit AcrA (membrane-fusion protein)
MSTSSNPAESARVDKPDGSANSVIHDRVVDIANQSRDRTELLKLLAADVRANFDVAIVAIQASHWSSPLMLVTDDLLSEQIQGDSIRELLLSSTRMPIACDIPIQNSPDNVNARGLRIELTSVPERAAVLLLYANDDRPSPTAQISDLKQLSLYADATRAVSPHLPLDRGELIPASARLAQSQETEALRNRNSLRLFHLDLDLNATSYRIANESRHLLGCDRTTVLVPKQGRYRVQAVSGVSVVDSRSNSVRSIERLTQAAMVMSRPLVLPTEEPLPQQIQEPMDEYLDESGVMSAILLPLHAPIHDDEQVEGIDAIEIDPFNGTGDIIGVMVLEYFSGRVPSTIGTGMSLVAGEATLALRNSVEHKQVFGLSLWKSVGRMLSSSRMPMVAGGLLLAAGLFAASAVYQIEHYVVATGSVEPTERREVFAAVDGIVKKLEVHDGQVVKAGDVLLELENAELENRAESLSGEILTATQRLTSIQAVRLSSPMDAAQSSRMALEERQLRGDLANLKAQQEIVKAQQEKLVVVSPIDGTVMGWQLERRLVDRPVARGNLLVSVADHEGPWSLRMTVPDENAGPILEASRNTPDLDITFAVATQPEASFQASLDSVGTAARLNDLGEHVLDVTAAVNLSDELDSENVDPFVPGQMRVGADVTAKVACGNRSVLRSWFGDVFDFVHRNILFYF